MTSRQRERLLALSAVTPILLWAWACSAPANERSRATNEGGSSGSSSDGGPSAGGSFSSGGGSSGGFGGGFDPGTGGRSSSSLDDGGCFATSSAAEQVVIETPVTITTHTPVDMLIMYDQSGSMDEETTGGSNKWNDIKAALIGFVNSPDSADIGVGIDYFPQVIPGAPDGCSDDADCVNAAGNFGTCEGLALPWVGCLGCSCSGVDICQVSAYSTPEVPIDLLPGVAAAIVNSVNGHSPNGNTPTRPALEGAHAYAGPWAAAHPDRKTIVVLATDGDPTQCSANSVQDVANIAANAFAANPSVMTFVIGVGSSLTSLNSIAAAGGSGQALIVDTTSGDPTQQFLDAMNQIRDTVTVTDVVTTIETTPVPCEWEIPPAPEGETFNKNEVNVDFSAGGASPQRIGFVASSADCAGVSGGWHYDDADNPTKVLVCPQTCTTIQAISNAQVDVVFGCATEPAIVQ